MEYLYSAVIPTPAKKHVGSAALFGGKAGISDFSRGTACRVPTFVGMTEKGAVLFC